MDQYRLLSRISVRHAYYADGYSSDLDFIPAGALPPLLSSGILIVKKEARGISLLFNRNRGEALRALAGDPPLAWQLVVNNSLFFYFTELSFLSPDAGLYLSSENAGPDGSLSKEACIGKADLLNRDDDRLTPFMDGRRYNPLGVVALEMADVTSRPDRPAHFFLSFASRETVWRYYLTGVDQGEDLAVKDAQDRIRFIEKPDEILPTGQRAKVFESDRAIPLAQHTPREFQLVRSGNRILIHRLPAAACRSLQSQHRDSSPHISQIFVNRH